MFFKEDYLIDPNARRWNSEDNKEWDASKTVLLMCVWCSSLMKTHKTNVLKYLNEFKPSKWHQPSVTEVGIQVVKNRFNPKSPRSKKIRGRFR
jgi:hypothetical protein